MTAMTDYSTSTHKQTLGLVLAAELRRSLAAGGLRVAVLVSVGLGILAGGLTVWALVATHDAASGPNTGLDTAPFLVSVFFAALAFAVGLIGFTSREMADGTATGSAILVPRRARLLGARLLSAVILGAAMTLASLVVVTLIRLLGGDLSSAGFGHMGSVIAIAVVDVALASALAFLVATLLRKPAIAVTVFLLALIVLPLVLSILSVAAPAWLANPAHAMLVAMPGTLFQRAMSVPTTPGAGWSDVAVGLGGLAAWVVAVAPFTWVLFDKALAGKE